MAPLLIVHGLRSPDSAMTTEHVLINCEQHGEAYATFVCAHLAAEPVQEWFCDYPTEDNTWPDSWCAQCNLEFEKHGRWNEENEDKLSIKLLCHNCYVDARSQSLDRLQGDALEAWNAFSRECCSTIQKRQEAFLAEYEISKHKRWDWDQDTGELVFSNDGVPAVVASIEFVGSISTISDTWLWSWANFSLDENVRTLIKRVRDFGEARSYPRLTTPKWLATEVDGWEMTTIAAYILEARGVYRTSDDNGFTFLALTDVRRA